MAFEHRSYFNSENNTIKAKHQDQFIINQVGIDHGLHNYARTAVTIGAQLPNSFACGHLPPRDSCVVCFCMTVLSSK